jgi:hypothetical protein
MPNELLIKILKRDEATCHLCGKYTARDEASLDHLVPRRAEGNSSEINLFLAHKSCNSERGSKTFLQYYSKADIISRFGDGTKCLACTHSVEDHSWSSGCDRCGCVGVKILSMAMFKPDGFRNFEIPKVITTIAQPPTVEMVDRCWRKGCKHTRDQHDMVFGLHCLICACSSYIWDMSNI